ncbi:MAG: hypothetical protein FHOMOCKG_00029 [Methanophagales virus GBV302]|uniref:Uncharacterized protein n=1 Tax=Methanophagales virus GBV302 TaxID=2999281 RepID=A0A9E8V843_9CAUD|nr:MAG: hypothetical protein QIT37_gp029 [Methanophagales virus GBV302]WAE39557.1 MAG: hypothetical protein FHOMOCKG_00029 [Methanophagales virus GBV302]
MKTIESINNDIILIKTATAVFLVDKRVPNYVELTFPTFDPETIKKIKGLSKSSADAYLCLEISDGFKNHILLFQILSSSLQMCKVYPDEDDAIIRLFLVSCDRDKFMRLLAMFKFTASSYFFSSEATAMGKWWDSITRRIQKGWMRSNTFSFMGIVIKKKEDETLEDIKRLMMGYITYLK